ncbi:MAG: hypothetical protein BAJALOKI2v1_340031 [Promethearchaeota archaeon]|nr:MAG: hypothetical protein BAJALOKI2v1_340031 [Candidatus Lokiarchaeota archaeon]
MSKKEWPSVDKYNGVIVASSIKGSFWRDEPKNFLRDNGNKILKDKKILGTFVCSAYSLIDKEKAKERYLEKILRFYKIHPHIYEVFGPVFDFSEDSELSKLDKKLLKLTARNISKRTGIDISENGRNDFRNWEEIKRFADGFSQFLLNQQII